MTQLNPTRLLHIVIVVTVARVAIVALHSSACDDSLICYELVIRSCSVWKPL